MSRDVIKKPVLFQLPTGLFIGLVCFNPNFETINFVLEKKDFFDVEWPAIVGSNKGEGFYPILIGLSHFVVQRSQILWYTLDIPDAILNVYKSSLPHIFFEERAGEFLNVNLKTQNQNLNQNLEANLQGKKEKTKKTKKKEGKIVFLPFANNGVTNGENDEEQ